METLGVIPYTTNRYGKNWRHFVFTEDALTWVEAPEGPHGLPLAEQVALVQTQRPDLGSGLKRVIPMGTINRASFRPGPGYPRLDFSEGFILLADCTFMHDWRHVDAEKTEYARSLIPTILPKRIELTGF